MREVTPKGTTFHPEFPLFVYGSLLWPENLEKLIQRNPTRVTATLLGWETLFLKNNTQPTITPAAGSTVTGVILTGLTADEWEKIDTFENEKYSLHYTVAHAHGKPLSVLTYALPQP